MGAQFFAVFRCFFAVFRSSGASHEARTIERPASAASLNQLVFGAQGISSAPFLRFTINEELLEASQIRIWNDLIEKSPDQVEVPASIPGKRGPLGRCLKRPTVRVRSHLSEMKNQINPPLN